MKTIYMLEKEKKGTKVYFDDQTSIHIDESPEAFLNRMCIENGSSYDGRKTAFQSITDSRQKPAILISERTQQIFFPTMSSRNEKCVWISYQEIFKVKESTYNTTRVTFLNGISKRIACDRRTIYKQMQRCGLFLETINSYYGFHKNSD